MRVQELVNLLQDFCHPDATLEMADGSSMDSVCYNAQLKRISIGTLDDAIATGKLADGWRYIAGDPGVPE